MPLFFVIPNEQCFYTLLNPILKPNYNHIALTTNINFGYKNFSVN